MTQLRSILIAGALATGAAFSAQAQDMHFIMCGGEVREADQKVVDAFLAANPGVTVNLEAVPWGTSGQIPDAGGGGRSPISRVYGLTHA